MVILNVFSPNFNRKLIHKKYIVQFSDKSCPGVYILGGTALDNEYAYIQSKYLVSCVNNTGIV